MQCPLGYSSSGHLARGRSRLPAAILPAASTDMGLALLRTALLVGSALLCSEHRSLSRRSGQAGPRAEAARGRQEERATEEGQASKGSMRCAPVPSLRAATRPVPGHPGVVVRALVETLVKMADVCALASLES